MKQPQTEQTPPTIRDIAERVGVHKATVAAVLNGGRSTARVSEATRTRIFAAAEDLRYVPNAMARGLKMVRFRSLGLVFNYPDPAWITVDQYGINLLFGIITEASAHGYNVTHFHKTWGDGSPQAAAGFRGQGIDGFLAIAPRLGSGIVSSLTELGVPLAVVSAAPEIPGIPHVLLDNACGIRLAMQHLFALGHRRIAYLTSAMDQYDAVERRNEYMRSMAEAGAPILPGYLVDVDCVPGEPRRWGGPGDQFITDTAYHEAQRVLRLSQPPTAIVTSGASAEAVIYAAQAFGARVPQDLSVVGFDDTPGAGYVRLTTIRQPLRDMGRCATQLLISALEREPITTLANIFQPELVKRESTAPPAC